jgi:hypothetical protein
MCESGKNENFRNPRLANHERSEELFGVKSLDAPLHQWLKDLFESPAIEKNKAVFESQN